MNGGGRDIWRTEVSWMGWRDGYPGFARSQIKYVSVCMWLQLPWSYLEVDCALLKSYRLHRAMEKLRSSHSSNWNNRHTALFRSNRRKMSKSAKTHSAAGIYDDAFAIAIFST
jgi:hypothetical protein